MLERPARARSPAAVTRAPAEDAPLRRFFVQLCVLALALLVTGLPILAHAIDPIVAILVCIVSAAMIAFWFEQGAPAVLIVIFSCQTTFVAMASSAAENASDLETMKLYNFITTIILWILVVGPFLLNYPSTSHFTRRMLQITIGILALSGIYFALGLLIDPRGSSIYMRNIGLPVILFQICYIVASRQKIALHTMVSLILGLLAGCGYLELFFTEYWLDITNGWRYWTLSADPLIISPAAVKSAQESGKVITSVIDLMTSAFLNTSAFGDLGLSVTRLQGPNFHPISFGYVLSILMTVSATHRRLILPALAFPLLLFISAKGAIILFVFSTTFCAITHYYRKTSAVIILYGLLLIYSIAVFISGFKNGDYHVLGLLGSLKGFVENPLGHTLGQGGNLSTKFGAIDWTVYQHAGSTDIAVESGIGVLLYQMGIAAILVIVIYLWISFTAWRLYQRLRAPALSMCCVMVAVILVNGIFQEEALFAPLALGLIMLIVGLTFGSVERIDATFASSPHISSLFSKRLPG